MEMDRTDRSYPLQSLPSIRGGEILCAFSRLCSNIVISSSVVFGHGTRPKETPNTNVAARSPSKVGDTLLVSNTFEI